MAPPSSSKSPTGMAHASDTSSSVAKKPTKPKKRKRAGFDTHKGKKNRTKEEILYGPNGYLETPARHAASSTVTPGTMATPATVSTSTTAPSTGISVSSSLTMATPRAPRAAAINARKSASTMGAIDSLPSPEVLRAQDLLDRLNATPPPHVAAPSPVDAHDAAATTNILGSLNSKFIKHQAPTLLDLLNDDATFMDRAKESVNFEKTRRAAIAYLFVHEHGAEWDKSLWKGREGIQAKIRNALGIPDQDITKQGL